MLDWEGRRRHWGSPSKPASPKTPRLEKTNTQTVHIFEDTVDWNNHTHLHVIQPCFLHHTWLQMYPRPHPAHIQLSTPHYNGLFARRRCHYCGNNPYPHHDRAAGASDIEWYVREDTATTHTQSTAVKHRYANGHIKIEQHGASASINSPPPTHRGRRLIKPLFNNASIHRAMIILCTQRIVCGDAKGAVICFTWPREQSFNSCGACGNMKLSCFSLIQLWIKSSCGYYLVRLF